MSTETETTTSNGSKAPIPSASDLANRAQQGRRRASATTAAAPAATAEQDDEEAAEDEDQAEAGETQEASKEEAPKKRRGPKPGSKRKAKEEPVAAAPFQLPEPNQLPLDYLIKCAKYLRQVRKEIEKLDE